MTRTLSATDALVNEADFQRTVVAAAQMHGWFCVHFPQMRFNPSGWPDLMLFRNQELLMAELKTERGRLGPAQQRVHAELAAVGFPVHVWRPSDWDAVVRVLKG